MKKMIPYLLVSLFFLLISARLYADDYSISGVDITIKLHDDGIMEVQEDRTYSFDGAFSFVYRTFPKDGQARFFDISVEENDVMYEESSREEPNTYKSEESEGQKKVTAHFDARDTSRTFTFRFKAEGAVERYEDAVLLYYQMISDEWDKPVENFTATIIPPDTLPEGEPPHWIHGSLEAFSEIKEGGKIEVELDRLPANQFLEIRALYPVSFFENMEEKEGYILEEVKEEAAALVEEANRLRKEAEKEEALQEERDQTALGVIIPAILIMLAISFYLYKKYWKSPPLEQQPVATSKPPTDHKPAEINYLMYSGQEGVGDFLSTLLDLAKRGFIKVEMNEKKKWYGGTSLYTTFHLKREKFNEHTNELDEYEHSLLQFLFEKMADENDQVEQKRFKKKSKAMQKFMKRWKKEVKKHAETYNWFDSSYKIGNFIGGVLYALLLVLFFVLTVSYSGWMAIPMVLAFILMLISVSMIKRTHEGERVYQSWNAFRNYLKNRNYRNEDATIDKEELNKYLIFGVALGLSQSQYKKLTNDLEGISKKDDFPWIIGFMHISQHGLGSGISGIVTNAGNTIGSASGAGGGGTAGGGGGAGSGGGGAG